MIFKATYAAWVVLGLVWVAGGSGNKRTARDESSGSRALHLFLTLAGFGLLFGLAPRHAEAQPLTGVVGLALTVAGVAFAIWARLTIGRNWSAMVTLKENHELVRRGPYRIVRHPIYTGILLAMLGSAIAFGRWPGYAGFAIAFVAFKQKSLTEEQFMVEQFGDAYVRYRTEVKALIPGVL
jgi:protein-S-isoprenylcysteine O-methyltransferase Ste14